ncbi:MAG: SAM-dependent methyltransferase [Betaproteobacteria bacterium]
MALAQAPAKPEAFEPVFGQAGKDAVWVPTPQALVDRMLDMAAVKPGERLIDLGSGDGRLVISAAKRGALALGVEYEEKLVEYARNLASREGVSPLVQFVREDLFETDLSGADVITLFLLRDMNLKLRPKLLALKPGTRIVANTFDLGEWLPDRSENLTLEDGCNSAWCLAMMWTVPARVAGVHQLPQGEFTLAQEFQMLSGTAKVDGREFPVAGSVQGVSVTLTGGGRTWYGKAKDGRLQLD